jgi:hypothetical protein
MKLKIFVLGFLVFLSQWTMAQCFSSTGNPIGGTANMGVMEKNSFRIATFYKNSYSGKYFEGDKLHIGTGDATAKDAIYNYVGMLFGYGITKKFTMEADAGYFINKTKNFATPVSGYGFSNLVVSAKYNILYLPVKRFEITAKLGIKTPLRTSAQIIRQGNLILDKHVDVQSSLGNVGFVSQVFIIKEDPFNAMRYFFLINYEHNFVSFDGFFPMKQYNFGNSLNTSVFVTKHLHMPSALSWLSENWTAIIQLRHEHKWKNQMRSSSFNGNDWVYGDWQTTIYSGSDVFFLSPQLNYTIAKSWNISVMVDIPLYQRYNGIQLATDYAFAVNISHDINFNKTVEP